MRKIVLERVQRICKKDGKDVRRTMPHQGVCKRHGWILLSTVCLLTCQGMGKYVHSTTWRMPFERNGGTWPTHLFCRTRFVDTQHHSGQCCHSLFAAVTFWQLKSTSYGFIASFLNIENEYLNKCNVQPETRPKLCKNCATRWFHRCSIICKPSAVNMRSGPNQTLALACARWVMANQTFSGPTTFGVFPAIASFGTGYIQQGRLCYFVFAHFQCIWGCREVDERGPMLDSNHVGRMDNLDERLDWLHQTPSPHRRVVTTTVLATSSL